MDEYAILRESFRPKRIRVLFIGESRPANGTFYYRGDSRLARYTCQAFGSEATPEMSGFLRRFHSLGCFLTDLCDQPANHFPRQERAAARRAGEAALADTIASAQPLAIVVVMIGIANSVKRASAIAGANAIPRYILPFPAQGHERDYVAKLRSIVSCLEEEGVLNTAR
jgi:hypothetical protein